MGKQETLNTPQTQSFFVVTPSAGQPAKTLEQKYTASDQASMYFYAGGLSANQKKVSIVSPSAPNSSFSNFLVVFLLLVILIGGAGLYLDRDYASGKPINTEQVLSNRLPANLIGGPKKVRTLQGGEFGYISPEAIIVDDTYNMVHVNLDSPVSNEATAKSNIRIEFVGDRQDRWSKTDYIVFISQAGYKWEPVKKVPESTQVVKVR